MNKIKFEQAMERLEQISQLLEQGSVPLDESLQLFQEARQLTDFCLGKLNEAEKKLQLLTKEDNSLQITDAEPE
jgi:exodeoxyribonuclease VII small subunit